MAERCGAVADAMAREAGVARVEYHERGLRGRAYPTKRLILVPRPTTRRRLFVFAHECAHVGQLTVIRKSLGMAPVMG